MSEAMVNENRRRFLKQAGVAGALAWTAPMITSAVQAQTPGTACEDCTGRAYGLYVKSTQTTSGTVAERFFGDSDTATTCEDATAASLNTASVTVDDACGVETYAVNCTATGSIKSFTISQAQIGTLTIQADPAPAGISVSSTTSCDCQTQDQTEDQFTIRLVNGSGAGTQTRDFAATGAANQPANPTNLTAAGTSLSGTFNRQTTTCTSGVNYLVTEAANLTLINGNRRLDIVIAHAEVSADCACP